MKIEEQVDNYLISSGCGISPECAYIAEDKYDYQEKETTIPIIKVTEV